MWGLREVSRSGLLHLSQKHRLPLGSSGSSCQSPTRNSHWSRVRMKASAPSAPVFIFSQVIEAHKSSCMFLFLLWLPGNSEPNSYLNVISHVTTRQSFCSKLFSDFACLLKLIYLSIIVFYLFSHFTVHIFVSHRSLHKHTQIFRICILCMYTYTFYMFLCLICAYVRLVIRKNNFSSISS